VVELINAPGKMQFMLTTISAPGCPSCTGMIFIATDIADFDDVVEENALRIVAS